MSEIILNGVANNYSFDPHLPKSKLDEEGMGVVYLGTNLSTNEEVAIKVIYRELSQNQKNVERAIQESNIKINHPNLLKMLDFVEHNGVYHIISEFLNGVSLDKFIEQNGTINQDYAIEIILKTLDGLDALHQANPQVIHRDIKPSNIFLCNDGNIKIMDFGVAKISDGKRKSLTGMGVVVGTPHYSAPEQIQSENHKINEKTDVYSLGITLYEILTGKPPFDAPSEFATLKMQIESPLPPNNKIKSNLFTIIKKATEKEQKNRFQSTKEFKETLNKFLNNNEQKHSLSGNERDIDFRKSKIDSILFFVVIYFFIITFFLPFLISELYYVDYYSNLYDNYDFIQHIEKMSIMYFFESIIPLFLSLFIKNKTKKIISIIISTLIVLSSIINIIS